jgi:hypothetical protein
VEGLETRELLTGSLAALLVSGPSTVTAGSPFQVGIIAKDASGNTVTTDNGSVSLYSATSSASGSGGVVSLPTSVTLHNGIGTAPEALFTAGSATFKAIQSTTQGTIRGTSNTIVVNPGAAYIVELNTPNSATVGSGFSISVIAQDKYYNGCNGPVTVTSSDGQPIFLSSPLILSNGIGSAIATLDMAGTPTLTATVGSVTGSSPIAIHLALSPATLPTATAGQSYTATMSATGGSGQYVYSVVSGTLPTGLTLSSAGLFSGTATIAGPYAFTVQATDSTRPGATGTQACTLTVNPGAADLLVVSGQSSVTAGTGFPVTITAKDAWGNTASGYNGSVTFTSSDGQPVLVSPASFTLTRGVGTAIVTLDIAHTIVLTATGAAPGSGENITGTNNNITVNPAAPSSVVLSAQNVATAGIAFPVYVTATDTYGNSCSGTATLTSTDGGSWSTTVTNGTGTFWPYFKTAHLVTLTASMGAASGSWSLLVQPGPAVQLSAGASNTGPYVGESITVTVYAYDACTNLATGYNGTITLVSSSATVAPTNVQIMNGTGQVSVSANHSGSVTLTPSADGFTSKPLTLQVQASLYDYTINLSVEYSYTYNGRTYDNTWTTHDSPFQPYYYHNYPPPNHVWSNGETTVEILENNAETDWAQQLDAQGIDWFGVMTPTPTWTPLN